ncbi:ribitol-5-phosphate dehydrogenase, putative [Babesia ovis]|uniref:Ribitol-5-phosphate dehydrogenase, putative n=1 Tax=Babesia ovis TaxID=5869 RepID=A0A9W5TDN5_BABOV|nr:ribitol-5-phosphate dehydrogenase, putative [Babesia ovis]
MAENDSLQILKFVEITHDFDIVVVKYEHLEISEAGDRGHVRYFIVSQVKESKWCFRMFHERYAAIGMKKYGPIKLNTVTARVSCTPIASADLMIASAGWRTQCKAGGLTIMKHDCVGPAPMSIACCVISAHCIIEYVAIVPMERYEKMAFDLDFSLSRSHLTIILPKYGAWIRSRFEVYLKPTRPRRVDAIFITLAK